MKGKFMDWFDWLMRRITFLVVLVMVFAGARWYEITYMPVVPVFDIDKAYWDDDILTVWGNMDKDRPCDYKGVQVFYTGLDGKQYKARVPRNDPIVSRPPIEQRFGPTYIELPRLPGANNVNAVYTDGTPLKFWATHVCHQGWTSYSEIAIYTPPPRT